MITVGSGEPAPRHLMLVFGATGDLSHRKLLPALYHIDQTEGAHQGHVILGVARAAMDDSTFRRTAVESLSAGGIPRAKAEVWAASTLHYQSLGDAGPAGFRALAGRVAEIERRFNIPSNRVFNLALPPAVFESTVEQLGAVGLLGGNGWVRLVLEKPFGHDLATARELNALIHRHVPERNVYRLDHFLGKDTVQNLLVLRFANAMFEPVWNRDRVDRVEITVAEQLGVEGRGPFYDKTGAVRDMLQNHMMQLLCLVAMEPPGLIEADSIANEKVKLARAVLPIEPNDVVFGQYRPGSIGEELVRGFSDEQGVALDSSTETYAAVRLRIANWRWQGVPFFLRTGKRLPKKVTRIVVTFRRPPIAMFHSYGACAVTNNRLEIHLQPDEGFSLTVETKSPGAGMDLKSQRMRFRYADAFGKMPEAYQTLLLDTMRGDRTLFVRADEIEAAWELFDPVLKARPIIEPYAAGSWGPAAADRLASVVGQCWTDL